jgi:hypothetical protein
MKYYGINSKGKILIQRVSNLPAWTADDESRIVYNENDQMVYCGNSSGWVLSSSGYSGYSGHYGVDGASGYSGYSGTQGYVGSDGASGYSGYSGIVGTTGTSGYSGLTAASGYSGIVGATGASGYSGYSSYSGTVGAAGTSGYSGYSGQADWLLQTCAPADSVTIDWSVAASATLLLDRASTAITITNMVSGKVYRLRLLQDGTGGRVVTWNDTIKWRGNSAPTLTLTADYSDIMTFWYVGTTRYGDGALNFPN